MIIIKKIPSILQFQNVMCRKYGQKIHRATNAGYLLGKKNELLQKDIDKMLRELLTRKITAEEAYGEIISKQDKF